MEKILNAEEVQEYLDEHDIKFFKAEEFACKHCLEAGITRVKIRLSWLQKVIKLRTCMGESVSLNSAYRCPEHPEEKIKKKPWAGFHPRGEAIDVRLKSRKYRAKLIRIAHEVKITGVGVANKFVHLDNRTWDAMFIYPGTK